MVRIRKKNGEVVPVLDHNAVEILDGMGNLAVVIIQQAMGSINILTPGDPLFNAHLMVTKQRPSRVVIHEPAPPVKNGRVFEINKR